MSSSPPWLLWRYGVRQPLGYRFPSYSGSEDWSLRGYYLRFPWYRQLLHGQLTSAFIASMRFITLSGPLGLLGSSRKFLLCLFGPGRHDENVASQVLRDTDIKSK